MTNQIGGGRAAILILIHTLGISDRGPIQPLVHGSVSVCPVEGAAVAVKRSRGIDISGSNEAIGLCASLVHFPRANVVPAGVVFLNPHEFLAPARNLRRFRSAY